MKHLIKSYRDLIAYGGVTIWILITIFCIIFYDVWACLVVEYVFITIYAILCFFDRYNDEFNYWLNKHIKYKN